MQIQHTKILSPGRFELGTTLIKVAEFVYRTQCTHSLTQSSEPRWGSIRHRQTSSIQTGPGPATAARSTSFQLFSSRPRWSSAKCRVVYPGASSQGAPKTAPRAGAGLSSCEGHGQATSTVFFSPPERSAELQYCVTHVTLRYVTLLFQCIRSSPYKDICIDHCDLFGASSHEGARNK